MKSLLAVARLIDAATDRLASLAKWAIFIACAVSAGNAVVRYSLDISSNAFLEIQWYLFAACVMLGAPSTCGWTSSTASTPRAPRFWSI